MAVWKLSAAELLSAYADGSLSPLEAMQATLERAEEVNPRLNAMYDFHREEALALARQSTRRWSGKAPAGPLDGVPVTMKDSIAVEGWAHWRGARARRGRVQATFDAPPVARMREAGAIIFAKTTMPDFGVLGAGVSSAHGVTRNPWRLDSNSGGSSAGAAASIAAGAGSISVGTDLGGSVRLPAALCGIFTLKPSSGLVPHLPQSAARVAGPMTRTVDDAALLLSVISQPDPRVFGEGRAVDPAVAPLRADGLSIGLLTSMGYGPPVEPEVMQLIEQAAARLAADGARVSPVPPPVAFDVFPDIDRTFAVRAATERASLPAADRGETLAFIGRYCDAADACSARDYLASLEAIEGAKRAFMRALSPFDFVLSPVLSMAGFPAEALGWNAEAPCEHSNFTALINQTGWPAASICCGFTPGGLPVGLQIIGPHGSDVPILRLARRFEELRGFDTPFPPG